MKTERLFGRIYGRFSSKPQERGDSHRRQTEGATRYAQTHKPPIEILKVYFDEAVSGKAGANLEKEFGRLLREAKPGETILVEQVDRIGRQHPIDVMNILKSQMVDRGLTVTFWQKGVTIDSSNVGNPAVLFSLFGETTVGYSDIRTIATTNPGGPGFSFLRSALVALLIPLMSAYPPTPTLEK